MSGLRDRRKQVMVLEDALERPLILNGPKSSYAIVLRRTDLY